MFQKHDKMHFMKKLIVILMVISLGFSCSNDDSDSLGAISASGNGTLLKKFTKTNSGFPQSVTTYEYDDQNRLSKMIFNDLFYSIVTSEFIYDGDSLAEIIVTTVDDFSDTITTDTRTLEYENGNIVTICKVIEEHYTDVGVKQYSFDRIGFIYDNNDFISQIDHYNSMGAPLDEDSPTCDEVAEIVGIDFDEKFVFGNDGNMNRYEAYSIWSGDTYYEYTYDDKNHPESGNSYEPLKKILGYSVVNNMTSLKQYNPDTDELEGSSTFEYEYNADGYPVKMVKKYESDIITQQTGALYEYY